MLLAKDKCGKYEAQAAGEDDVLPTKEPKSPSSWEDELTQALQVNLQQQPSPVPAPSPSPITNATSGAAAVGPSPAASHHTQAQGHTMHHHLIRRPLGKQVHAAEYRYGARARPFVTYSGHDGGLQSYNETHIAGGGGAVFVTPRFQQQPMVTGVTNPNLTERGRIEEVLEHQPDPSSGRRASNRQRQQQQQQQQQRQQTATANPHITLPAPVRQPAARAPTPPPPRRAASLQQPTVAESLQRSRSRVRSRDQAPAPAPVPAPSVRSAQTQTYSQAHAQTQTQPQAETASTRRQPSGSRQASVAPAPAAADPTEPTEPGPTAADPLARYGVPQPPAKVLTRSESVQPVRRTGDALPRSLSLSAAGRGDRNVAFQREDNRRDSFSTTGDSWAESI
ncbi:hypothetical protein MAPG_12134 [Magnaporthiopsis poae ATCC 64411]|uniref:Uncharacterized protein n=1 Tax=Magnaporthiopsis poae (strain ATCC 64411 / 73-15) TaxID=644358 RepID=A0A0C4EGW7_MAGP6|nr:hypothetical protein MAPG_12134 [Magnaporthiopsis poae ATCC 64411]